MKVFSWRIRLPPNLLNRPKIDPSSIYADIPIKISFLARHENSPLHVIGRKHSYTQTEDEYLTSEAESRFSGVPPKTTGRRRLRPGPRSSIPPQKKDITKGDTREGDPKLLLEDDNIELNNGYYGGPTTSHPYDYFYTKASGQVGMRTNASTTRSLHHHGPSLLVTLALLAEACITTGLAYLLIGIGVTGGLAEMVNTRFLLVSTPAPLSIILGFYFFVLAKRLDPESKFILGLATIYFALELLKFSTDIWNIIRFITEVSLNDQWYLLLTSRDYPRTTGSTLAQSEISNVIQSPNLQMGGLNDNTVGEVAANACVSFVHQLKEGHCGKPRSILILLIVSLTISAVISMFFLMYMIGHTILAENYRYRKIHYENGIDHTFQILRGDTSGNQRKRGRGAGGIHGIHLENEYLDEGNRSTASHRLDLASGDDDYPHSDGCTSCIVLCNERVCDGETRKYPGRSKYKLEDEDEEVHGSRQGMNEVTMNRRGNGGGGGGDTQFSGDRQQNLGRPYPSPPKTGQPQGFSLFFIFSFYSFSIKKIYITITTTKKINTTLLYTTRESKTSFNS